MAVRGGAFKPIVLIFAVITFAGSLPAIIAQETDAAPAAEEVAVEAAPVAAEEAAEAPAAVEEVAAAVEDAPAVVDDAPAAVDDAPAAVDDAPAAVEDAPAAAEDTPAAAEDASAAVDDAPAAVDDAPAAVDDASVVDVAAEGDPIVEDPVEDPVVDLPVSRMAEDDVVLDMVDAEKIDSIAAAESAEVTADSAAPAEPAEPAEPAAPAEPVAPAEPAAPAEPDEPALDTFSYVVPSDPLTTLVVAEGDAFTLPCYSINEKYRKYAPLLKWRPNAQEHFINLFMGDSPRPESKNGVTVEVDGDVYNYNFHAAVAGFGGEYECDYTVGEQDPVYHVIVLLKESVTCPAGGSFKDESMIPEVSCSVQIDGFFPDGYVSPAAIRLGAEEGVELVEEYRVESNRLTMAAQDIYVVRPLNGKFFECIFPVVSASLSLSCQSEPLQVLWDPKGLQLHAPTDLIKDEAREVSCRVSDLGNPPVAIELYAVGNEDAGTGSQEGTEAVLTYTEHRQITSVQFVCRTPALHELTQTADVFYGPAAVTSTSSDDSAVMVENDVFSWECFATPSNPPAEIEYFICKNPEDDSTCQKIKHDKELLAVREWQHQYLKCSATNPRTLHEVVSNPHKIDVHHPPIFTGKESDKTIFVRKGEAFALNCEHESNPEDLVYAWEKQVFDERDAVILNRRRRHPDAEVDMAVEEEEEVEEDPSATPAAVLAEEAPEAVTAAPMAPIKVPVDGTPAPVVAVEEEEAVEAVEATPAPVVVEEEAPAAITAAPVAPVEDSVEEAEEVPDDHHHHHHDHDASVEAKSTEDLDPELPDKEPAEPELESEENAVDAAPDSDPTVIAEEKAEPAEEPAVFALPPLIPDEPPLPPVTTARPLLPSVDLSGHNHSSFPVLKAEPKHFGTYVCKAQNAIGFSQIRYKVKENTKPKPTPKADSASLLRTPVAIFLATLLSVFILN